MIAEIKKGWGKEVIFASNEMYCGKLMIFDKAGSKGSMHYHLKKDESWYVSSGSFKVIWIETTTAKVHEHILETGHTWRNRLGEPHQLEALENNSIIFEVSTADFPDDSYRIFPGDSQQ